MNNLVLLIDLINIVVLSEYGYDSASACGRELRKQRARELPCDFNKQSWCTIAGQSYPWQAVRRFVNENHGLMRRMYGDERHLSVLQHELENIAEETPNSHERSRLKISERYRNLKDQPTRYYSDLINANIYITDDENEANKDFTHARYLNKHDDVLMNTKFTFADAEFRPNDLFTIRQTLLSTTSKPMIMKFPDGILDTKHPGPDPIQEVFNNDLDNGSNIHSSVYNNFTIVVFEKTTNNNNNNRNQTTMTTTTMVTLNETTTTEIPTVSTENTTLVTPDEITTENLTTSDDSFLTEPLIEENTTIKSNIASHLEEFHDSDYHDEPAGSMNVDNMESQLFQDADQEFSDSIPEPVKLKGVNACPVKEEVVAPFWANNTRGEILALLNLYPFEQYVHWEKCTFEHKQMYCREGCRCEQQYRLHRLLAYDPNNECRGIFSDWFRFPSCCVCKCYNLPTEFRVTSRSPRGDQPELQHHQRRAKIDPEWYRPSASSDINPDSDIQ